MTIFFRKHRITGRRRRRPVFGKPDFVFPKLRLAIFVDSCFWHCCPRHSSIPANNRPFWAAKLASNKRRDWLVNRTLRRRGWSVHRVWEHELTGKNQGRLLGKIRLKILIHEGHE